MKPITTLVLIFTLVVSVAGYAVLAPIASAATIPTFSIVSVVKDNSVTIQTANFPQNVDFDVRMGRIGTRGVNGVLVTKINSGQGGVFQATFNIPTELKGQSQIAIRLESPATGYFSYNWFSNETGAQGTPSTPSTPGVTATTSPTAVGTTTPRPNFVIPTFTIVSVVRDQSVTIQTANFPPNQTFEVRMGRMWTRGINGVLVTTIDSGTGGTFTGTFNIPAELAGMSRISIRLESPTSGYFSYNWFWNNSTTVSTPGTPAPTQPQATGTRTPTTGGTPAPTSTGAAPSSTTTAVVPTISIVTVVKDTSVTIQTANFPANQTFDVLMGRIGTRGVNGIKVATINSGQGGVFQATFNIPTELKGQSQIAIRLESPASGYFSYNFFNNQ